MSKLKASEIIELDDDFLDSIISKLESRINKENQLPKHYNVSELEPILKITQHSIRRLLKEGKIRGSKLGKKWIVSHKNLTEFLKIKNN